MIPVPSQTGSGAAILVVDDNPSKRVSIDAILAPLGHVIVEADCGEAALRAVMEQSFAVILMDVQMPGMDGYETARLIRMRVQSELTPIVFLTADVDGDAQLPIAYASGAVDFLSGRIVPSVLCAKVSVFVEIYLKSLDLERSLREVTTLSNRFRDSEAHTRSVLDHVADGIVTLDAEGIVESLNRAACELLGYAEEEAIGLPFSRMMSVEGTGVRGSGPPTPGAVGTSPAEATGLHRDGSTFPVEFELSALELDARTIHIVCLRDISARQTFTDSLQYAAVHDDLTGLPNRGLFADRVEQAIRSTLRNEEPLALLLLDLNSFKRVNDTYGHRAGDLVLQGVADRLVACLRDSDTVARLGGDEFAILPSGSVDVAGAAAVVWKIEQALKPEFVIDGNAISMEASIGIALVPDHGTRIDDLLRRADLALYEAKRSGSGYAVFASEQEDAPARRLALLGDLRHCAERGELVLHYQPKVDLATKETIGVEALIRWAHPTRGLLMPGSFMPEVENSDLMLPITKWVLNEALHQLHVWRESGLDLTMAVNLGARCLVDAAAFFETVDALIAAWEISPESLTFELTESALLDTSVPGLLGQLEAMDERLSIDDFGTGYSSLVYLRRLPVVEIKADRSFVTSLATVREDAVIVRAIIDLAHNLGVKVVAEGVEDVATMHRLIEYGCDIAQGFLFSKPLAADELTSWLGTSAYGPRRLGSNNSGSYAA